MPPGNRCEIDAHHDSALGGPGDVAEARLLEDAQRPDADLVPGDLLAGREVHRVPLERGRPTAAGEVDGRRGQRAGDPAPAMALGTRKQVIAQTVGSSRSSSRPARAVRRWCG